MLKNYKIKIQNEKVKKNVIIKKEIN